MHQALMACCRTTDEDMEGSAASGLVQGAGLSTLWKRMQPQTPAERNAILRRTPYADSAQGPLRLAQPRRASALHVLAEDVLDTVQAAGILPAPLPPGDRSGLCVCPCCGVIQL